MAMMTEVQFSLPSFYMRFQFGKFQLEECESVFWCQMEITNIPQYCRCGVGAKAGLWTGLIDWTVDWNLDRISKCRLVGIRRLCTMQASLTCWAPQKEKRGVWWPCIQWVILAPGVTDRIQVLKLLLSNVILAVCAHIACHAIFVMSCNYCIPWEQLAV